METEVGKQFPFHHRRRRTWP